MDGSNFITVHNHLGNVVESIDHAAGASSGSVGSDYQYTHIEESTGGMLAILNVWISTCYMRHRSMEQQANTVIGR